jgi:hypothetical protein
MKKPSAAGPVVGQAVEVTHVMHVDQRILDDGTAAPISSVLTQPHANELFLSEPDGSPTATTSFGFAKQHQPTTLLSIVVNVDFPPVGGAGKVVSATLTKDPTSGASKLSID